MQIEIVNSRKEKLILKIILYLTIGCVRMKLWKLKRKGSWIVIGEEIKIKKAWRCGGLAFTRTSTRFGKRNHSNRSQDGGALGWFTYSGGNNLYPGCVGGDTAWIHPIWIRLKRRETIWAVEKRGNVRSVLKAAGNRTITRNEVEMHLHTARYSLESKVSSSSLFGSWIFYPHFLTHESWSALNIIELQTLNLHIFCVKTFCDNAFATSLIYF